MLMQAQDARVEEDGEIRVKTQYGWQRFDEARACMVYKITKRNPHLFARAIKNKLVDCTSINGKDKRKEEDVLKESMKMAAPKWHMKMSGTGTNQLHQIRAKVMEAVEGLKEEQKWPKESIKDIVESSCEEEKDNATIVLSLGESFAKSDLSKKMGLVEAFLLEHEVCTKIMESKKLA